MNSALQKQTTEIIEAHKKRVCELQANSLEKIAAAAEAITAALKHSGTVYICGNGGSAADAQHIAAELIGRFKADRKALPAVALTTNSSVITSIANDYSYQQSFSRQVEALIRKGDVLWAISTSGESENVIAAVESARQKGACILALTGRGGSTLEKIADICICANDKSTARSQEIHQIAYHIICELVEQNFCK